MPIAIPSINPEAVKPIFSILIGAYEADILLSIIQIIFFLWLLVFIAYCLFALYKKQYGKPLTGLVAIIAIAVLLPPLRMFRCIFLLLA